MGKQSVGHHFDISTHAGEGIDERQSVQRTGGVVGDDHQRAIFRDVFDVVLGDFTTYLQMLGTCSTISTPFR